MFNLFSSNNAFTRRLLKEYHEKPFIKNMTQIVVEHTMKNITPEERRRLKTMALTIEELIAQKETISAKKKALYDVETSIGTITVKLPSSKLLADAWNFSSSMEGNKYIVYECTITPDLKNKELQKAYGVVGDPMDIVPAIFQPGEITRIASAILDEAGYKDRIKLTLHNEIKN